MLKLPVIVYNHHDKAEVINSVLNLQHKLELLSIDEEKNGWKYIILASLADKSSAVDVEQKKHF